MKYMVTNAIGNVLAVYLLCNLTVCYASPLFVDNQSGWAITVQYSTKDVKNREIPMRQGETFKEIDDLNKITDMSFYRRGNVWGSLASTQPLKHMVVKLQRDMQLFPKNYRGKDPVIVIEGTTLGWNVKDEWRKSGDVIAVESFDFVTLDDVAQGKLTADLAQKANDILNADYTNARAKGFIDLAHRLKSEFSTGSIEMQKREQPVTVKGQVIYEKSEHVLTPTSLPASQAAEIVNKLYRTFTNYKTKKLIV